MLPYEKDNIIQQIQTYPELYGYEFLNNQEKLKSEYYNIVSSKNVSIICLTPPMTQCLKCHKHDGHLQFRAPPFSKDAYLYTLTSIGHCI